MPTIDTAMTHARRRLRREQVARGGLEELHLTMQGIGFTDEIEDIDTIAEAIQARLIEPYAKALARPPPPG
ncbi:hypothetical protein [Nonomuraea sp. NPDC003754]